MSVAVCECVNCHVVGDKTAGGNSYQNGPDFNSTEFKAQKEDFFSKKQTENAMRRE